MPESQLLQPDRRFLQDVLSSGGSDLKKCFQCATCSAVCELAPEDAPFPRAQIAAAQWGLKEKLVGDPALWLCYNCGDCTARCPRGARPGDIMGALRRQAVKHFAFPRFLGEIVAHPRALPLLFLLPALIFAAIWLWGPHSETARLEFANVFSAAVLEPLFYVVSAFVILAFAVGAARFARALPGPVLPGLAPALREVAAHGRFHECGAHRDRRLAHMLTMGGFLGLGIVGTTVGAGTMAGWMHTPLAAASPLKIFANLCALAALAGVVLLVVERARAPHSTYFDWFFLAVLAGVVATGILAELLRLAQSAAGMYPVYFVHLVLIFSLFLYAPYSKFAHLVYRTVALAWLSAPKKG
jgi:quinone-modifying oxidoreductase, subunit QmoC